jgi:hypothetical protein
MPGQTRGSRRDLASGGTRSYAQHVRLFVNFLFEIHTVPLCVDINSILHYTLFVVNTNKQESYEQTIRRSQPDATINRSLILSRLPPPPAVVRNSPPMGLTRSTVATVGRLIAADLVHETGIGPSHGGRPGTLLELNPAGGCSRRWITADSPLVLLTGFGGSAWRRNRLANHQPDAAISRPKSDRRALR